MLGEHGLWQKFEFYEGSCGVPLLIRVPGVSCPGVCQVPISQVSLLPTLRELCGVPISSPLDGVSLAEQIRRPETDSGLPVFAEYNLRRPQAKDMIRDGSYKFTYWTHDRAELYDLQIDPHEMNNLASAPRHARTAARLQEKLFA